MVNNELYTRIEIYPNNCVLHSGNPETIVKQFTFTKAKDTGLSLVFDHEGYTHTIAKNVIEEIIYK